MNRLITKKPVNDTKLTFAPMGSKPGISTAVATPVKKVPAKAYKPNKFAKKAAKALVGKA